MQVFVCSSICVCLYVCVSVHNDALFNVISKKSTYMASLNKAASYVDD